MPPQIASGKKQQENVSALPLSYSVFATEVGFEPTTTRSSIEVSLVYDTDVCIARENWTHHYYIENVVSSAIRRARHFRKGKKRAEFETELSWFAPRARIELATLRLLIWCSTEVSLFYDTFLFIEEGVMSSKNQRIRTSNRLRFLPRSISCLRHPSNIFKEQQSKWERGLSYPSFSFTDCETKYLISTASLIFFRNIISKNIFHFS